MKKRGKVGRERRGLKLYIYSCLRVGGTLPVCAIGAQIIQFLIVSGFKSFI